MSQKIKSTSGVSIVQEPTDTLTISEISGLKGNKVILLGDTCYDEVLQQLAWLKADQNVLVAFSNTAHYAKLKSCPQLLYYPSMNNFDAAIFVQQLCSRLPLSADFASPDSLISGIISEKKVLTQTHPNFCGLDTDYTGSYFRSDE